VRRKITLDIADPPPREHDRQQSERAEMARCGMSAGSSFGTGPTGAMSALARNLWKRGKVAHCAQA